MSPTARVCLALLVLAAGATGYLLGHGRIFERSAVLAPDEVHRGGSARGAAPGDGPPPRPADDDEAGLLDELRRAPFETPGAARGPDDAPAPPGSGPSASASGAAVPGSRPSLPGERDPLVDALKGKVDLNDPGQLLAFLIATFTPNGSRLGPEDLEFLFTALGAQGDFGIRNLLFSHLERIGGEEATRGILDFVARGGDPNSVIRGLQALGMLRDEAAVRGLAEYMATAANGRLREAAFQSLLSTGSEAATDTLLSTLSGATDQSLKRYSLAALSQLGGARGAEAVLSYAMSADPSDRALGMKSLRDLKSPDAIPALADALARSSDPEVRVQSIRALGRTRDAAALPSALSVALNDANPGLRVEAVRVVAQLGRADALPTLVTIASEDKNPTVRRTAERAIETIQRREAR